MKLKLLSLSDETLALLSTGALAHWRIGALAMMPELHDPVAFT